MSDIGVRITQSPEVVFSPHGEGALLLDTASGRRITLDPFGRVVWESLVDAPTLPELLLRLRDESTPAERLAEDVSRLLARWRAQGLIRWR